MITGRVEKMRIDGYELADFTRPTGTFYVQVNPETFTRNYTLELETAAAAGNAGAELGYKGTAPQTMDVEFLLDGTGVLLANGAPNNLTAGSIGPELDVSEKVKELKRIIYDFIGNTHEIPFVKITWAKETFNCRVTAINVTYKLFKPDGTPLRALVKCTFKEHVPAPANDNATRASSPDLTHIRFVKQGDSLPFMCYNIYGDEKLYLEVARANGLTDFRKLTTGQKIYFPPIEKTVVT